MPPRKRYLMAPGPTPVPPEVLAAGAQPVLHHRGPDFRAVMLRTLARLQEVCRTENDVLLFTASGSAAFESAVVNLLSPGERVLAVMAGEFGERWAALARVYGVEVRELRDAGGETPRADDVRTRLEETGAKVVFVVHSETSTGVVSDVQALSQAGRDTGALVVALGLLLEEGLESAFARHAALGRACREGAKAMGLELFSPDEERSAIVTAILAPDGVDARELVLALRDRFGITVASGHGELASRLFRIGHIGYYDVLDITTVLAAVEFLLVEAGADVERGTAVVRALEAYREAVRVES